ncbi:MAG: protein-L-isoaspartate(D-aspartate) O-methyltransferase [Alphaproteobacteria bacterium]
MSNDNTDPRVAELVDALRQQGISDEHVLAAIARTPRDVFVEAPFTGSAYANTALPIACGQTISQPYVVAVMTQALGLSDRMRVLEIGTGSGYQAAVLARLARMVYTVERHKPLLKEAEARFRKLRLDNIVTRHGDGYQGWPEQAPFDRLIATAAFRQVPENLIEQLRPGGVMVAPVGYETISQDLLKIIRSEDSAKGYTAEALLPVVFVPMVPGLPPEGERGKDRKS